MSTFFAELKRRNVFKVGIAYAIVAWLLIEVVTTIFPVLALPIWSTRLITIVILIGFPIAIFLAWAYELTPEGIKPTDSVDLSDSITHHTGRKLDFIIIGLMALAIAFLVIDNYVLKETPQITKQESAPAAITETVLPASPMAEEPVTGPPTNSIAVLPFKNMSSDPEQEYFADGIAEELLNSLSRIKDLEVRGRTSSFYFKDRNEDLHTISEMLNVGYVLEGSVRRAGEQVRITVQLIDTRTDDHIWSETYEHTMEDIFRIQDDIARSVAGALQISLGVGELGRAPGMTRNVEAYESLLAARPLAYQLSRENVSRAIELLEQAVALDPEFASAWGVLAVLYQAAGSTFISEKADEFIKKRDASRSRVIELVPKADYALRIKAAQSGDLAEVERLYQQALAQDPANPDNNLSYGNLLINVGQPTAAVEHLQRTVRIEPLASFPYVLLGIGYEFSGNNIAATTEYKRARELSNDPAFINATLLVLALEENDRARIDEHAAPAVAGENELNPNANRPGSRNLNQVMLSLLDTPEAARAELRQFLTDPAYINPGNRVVIAVWASYFGEHALALQVFQEASESSVFSPGPLWRPIHHPMRRLPGFKDLVTKIGLVDYWRTSGNWGDFCRPVGEDDFECE